MPRRRNLKFGVVLPPDNDPRWIPTQQQISPQIAYDAMPIGTVLHPSRWAYMNDYALWKQIGQERQAIFDQQKEQRRQLELEQERLRKIEERKFKQEQEALKKAQKELTKQLDTIQKNYQREIRQVTRGIDAEYNPQIKEIQKQLKLLSKQIE